MSSDSVVRRLRAWHAGAPLPLYSTRHFRVVSDEDLLILAFVRMGGESAPWGIALGHPGAKPHVFNVPEARNRDMVADMIAAVAPVLLEHFRHPDFSGSADPQELPLRQLWVPNPSHLDLLHALAYSYTFTKWGSSSRAKRLNAAGRLCGWLFREAQRPGQVTVLSATEALRRSYTFPSSDIRQAHLGFLLAWLETRGKRDSRLKAAQEAEQRSISISLDPALERDELADLVEQWGEAHRAGDTRREENPAREIARRLEPELRHRFELVERAIGVLRADKRRENTGVGRLVEESKKEHWYQYVRLEHRLDDHKDGPAFVPSPETDKNPAAAAARYYVHEQSEEFRVKALLHDDEELQDEVIAAGEALRGKITAVWDDASGAPKFPVWTITTRGDVALRVRRGTTLCVAGLASRTVCIREIKPLGNDGLEVTLDVIGLKTVPRNNTQKVLAATDPKLKGKIITLLPTAADGISRLKASRIWERDVVGGWLTHARPGGAKASALDDELADPTEGEV